MEPTTKAVVELNDANEKLGIAYNTKLLQDNGLEVTDENIFIAAACGDKGIAYLKGDRPMGIRYKEAPKAASASKDGAYTANVDGKNVTVKINAAGDAYTATVNGKTFNVKVSEGAASASAAPAASSGEGKEVKSPLPGTITKIIASEGAEVAAGEVIMIIEAMKMETEIKAEADCVINSITVNQGAVVASGDVIAVVEEK